MSWSLQQQKHLTECSELSWVFHKGWQWYLYEGGKRQLRHQEHVLMLSLQIPIDSQGAKPLLDLFLSSLWKDSSGCHRPMATSYSVGFILGTSGRMQWTNHNNIIFPPDLNWWWFFFKQPQLVVCQPRKQPWKQQAICQTSKENILVSHWLTSNIMLVNNRIPVWHISPWTLTENYWSPFYEPRSGSHSFQEKGQEEWLWNVFIINQTI